MTQSFAHADASVCATDGAFESLFRELYAPLVRAAYSVVASRETAEDVVGDVFLTYWKRPELAAAALSPKSYLYRAVRNRALNVLRERRAMRAVPLDVAAQTMAYAVDPAPATESVQALDIALARAVAQLPERCRLVYTLSREHRMTYAEIADALSISVKTVETQISRALVTLRRALSDYLP